MHSRRDAITASRKKGEELQAQLQKLQGALEKAEAHARESAAQSKDWEKKAAELKKSVEELSNSYSAVQGTAANRVKELELQLKRAGEDLAASKAENRKSAESAEAQDALEKKAGELEKRARWSDFSLAKANTELQSQRAERERAEKSAASAAAQLEKLEEKVKRQVEFERASEGKIEKLEKTVQERDDELARASATLRKEVEDRQLAQKQSRVASEACSRMETDLAAAEDSKKVFEESLIEKGKRLQVVERWLAEANSGLERESSERRRLEGLLADARQHLERLSAELFTKASRLYSSGLYSECHELTKELMGTLQEKTPVFGNAWNLHNHTLTKLGRYEEAKKAAQQRIKEIEDNFGKRHPSLICPLNNLAAILDRTGFVFEAEQARRRILSIAEKCTSVDDLDFGTYLSNSSYSPANTYRYEGAECH